MTTETKPPRVPGEKWRTIYLGCIFAVDGDNAVHCWWPEGREPVGWDAPLPPTGNEERARAEKAEAERDAYRAMALGPVCEACDSETATNVTPAGFHGCDEHRSPDSVDLSYAAALRTIGAES